MDKFGRNYQLTILINGNPADPVVITLPFTIEFDIVRNTLSGANVAQFRIYNLSETQRNKLRFNGFEYLQFHKIELRAGYGENPPAVFTGNIHLGWSVREGVNFITQLESFDGGFAFVNGHTETQFPAGVPDRTKIQTFIKDLPHVEAGAVGAYTGVSARGNSYSGNTTDILREISGGGFFVDNGKANVLKTNEFILGDSAPILINSQSGLLGTPVLENTLLRFDMLFEPQLEAGRMVILDSITEKAYNGQYKITSVKHRGMISAAVCGSVITSGEFMYTKELVGVPSGV